MLKASNDKRGTVVGLAALSQDLDDANTDGMLNSHVMTTISGNLFSWSGVFTKPLTLKTSNVY
jgi:hypothetical protein